MSYLWIFIFPTGGEYPNTGPFERLHKIADFSLFFEQFALKGLFSLFIKLNINALQSVADSFFDSLLHSCSANPPNMFPFVDFIIVKVCMCILAYIL